jgi:phosphohistidine phosphatase
MKTLILMRHAHANWDDNRWPDFDRPLTPRGEEQAPRMGQRLARHGIRPDKIICSSAVRTRQTAEHVAGELNCTDRIQAETRLYLCPVSTWELAIDRFPEEWNTIVAVGHNDGLEQLVSYLRQQPTHVPPAGVSIIQLPQWAGFDRTLAPESMETWNPE